MAVPVSTTASGDAHATAPLTCTFGPQGPTLGDLIDAYLQDYQVRQFRSVSTARGRTAHLAAFFGRAARAATLTTYQIRQYQLTRRAAGAATGTINRETSALHRMCTLADHWGWLDTVPGFPDRLRENPPRQGFFEHPEYLAVRAHLPAPWQDILDLAYVEYAREELRAEMSAMMTGERVGVGHDGSRGAAYVKGWLKALEQDPKEMYKAAADAQRISDYLMRPIPEREQTTDKEHGELAEKYSAARSPKISETPAPLSTTPHHAIGAGRREARGWRGAYFSQPIVEGDRSLFSPVPSPTVPRQRAQSANSLGKWRARQDSNLRLSA